MQQKCHDWNSGIVVQGFVFGLESVGAIVVVVMQSQSLKGGSSQK
jgi:hypothetical protein